MRRHKDVTVVTEDYLLDDLERSQLKATRRRRWNRSRRYYRMLLFSIGFVALLVLAAPSLVSHTGVARSMLASQSAEYGWVADAESINVGWITPLTIKGLDLVGESGETHLKIQRIDTALTVTDLIRFDPASTGELTFRGVELESVVRAGASSIESDLALLLEPSDSQSDAHATIQIQDAAATLTDVVSGNAWVLSQSNMNLVISGSEVTGDVAGMVNEPSGASGAIQSQFHLGSSQGATAAEVGHGTAWELSIEAESFPLSVADLVSRRFQSHLAGLPQQFSGDTTGTLKISGSSSGALQAELGDLRVRGLQATSTDKTAKSAKAWSNQLAMLDGELTIADGWLKGRGLTITTDFASAGMDGSFPTTISLVGTKDNPLSWLQALQGTARVDVDLASLDAAMPGLIPLRQNVSLVSGRARAVIENSPHSSQGSSMGDSLPRRSKLTLSSDALRARADGRMVIVDPIELSAIVTDRQGELTAERFDLSSSFATASGSGTMHDGVAEVQVDFGRLYTMLRPIVDLSEMSLGGTAGGQVHWAVTHSPQNNTEQWDLSGKGEAKDLLVTLPSGHRFARKIVQGDVTARGEWNGRSLKQLTLADIGIRSGGVSFRAALVSAVNNPTADSMFPLRLETDGRLENLSESLRPWLPESLLSAQGRLTGSATAKVSRSGGTLSKADFVISQPRINYANRWYTQPSVTVNFDGVLDWPSGNFAPKELTFQGDALTMAVRGEVTREKTNLDIAFNADLQRIQDSIGSTIARAASTKLTHPISFRPVQSQSYQVSGLCKGNLNLTGGPSRWRLQSNTTATNIAVYRPVMTGNLPPGTPTATFGQSFGQNAEVTSGELLWQEPRLKVDGMGELNLQSGELDLPELQIASDGFAATFAGKILSSDEEMAIELSGPTRWKMDVIADRLTRLLGTPVKAAGIHESPVKLTVVSARNDSLQTVVEGKIGWDACELAGVRLGQTAIPIRATQDQLMIQRSAIPIVMIAPQSNRPLVKAGQATLGATVHYATSPAIVKLEAGSTVDSLQITPDTASQWLQYLAPLAAGATSLDGNVSATFQESTIVIDDPSTSEVRGKLSIQDLRLSSGPLANQLIQGVQQIKSLAKLAGGPSEPYNAKTLIEMPPQEVDFSLENGVVTHQRMYFKIDRASLMTSGQVGIDTQMNMVTYIPLDPSWLGSDLKGLAGQTLTFPITGTLSRPRLDDSVLRTLVSDLGTRAGAEVIQSRLDGLIQKQLGTGIDQINKGVEKILGF